MDAGQIAMEWVAFSNSRSNCKLNFETLDLLDRERLTKKARKVGKLWLKGYDVHSSNKWKKVKFCLRHHVWEGCASEMSLVHIFE